MESRSSPAAAPTAETQVVGIEPGAREPVTLELQPQGRIRGVVVDTDGGPVPKAQVMVTYESTAGGSHGMGLPCDSKGRFQHDVDAFGRLVLTARAPGFGSTDVRLEVAPGQIVDDLRLVLEPGVVVEGRVLGPDGDPIASAGVRVYQEQIAHRFGIHPTTDADGRFRLEGFDPGVLWLWVRAEGFAEEQRQVDLEPGTNTVEIRFATPREIHGRVIDEAWNPVAEASVGASSSSRRGGARTDDDGSFVIEGLADGSYRLSASKQGFARTELDREIEIDGGPVFGVDIQLSAGGSIAGRVLGLQADRLAGLSVTLEPAGRSAVPEMAEIDAEGGFRFEHLQSGEWTLTATEETSNRSVHGVTVLGPGNDEVFVELEFVDGVALAGRVLVDGVPAAGVGVEARGLEVLSESRVVTDYRGSFQLVDLRPGRYRVEARRDELVRHVEIELKTDRELEIELSTHAVGGRTVDADAATALGGATVTLQALSDAGDELPGRYVPQILTDSQGFFRFVGVAEGTYRLRVEHRGYGTLERSIRVEEGSDLTNLELRLDRTQGLKLKVRKAVGGPPRGVVVVALDGAGIAVSSHWSAVDEDGTAHLSSLPAGHWLLVIGAEGAGIARLPVEVPSEPVTVVLPSATRIDVKVPDLMTTGELATLTVTDPADRPFVAVALSQPVHLQSEWTVRAGWASVEGLPSGRWRLSVTASDGRSWETSVTAPENGGHLLVELE